MLRKWRSQVLLVVLLTLLQAIAVSATSTAFATHSSAMQEGAALLDGPPDDPEEESEVKESRGGRIARWMVAKGISKDLVVVVIAAMPIVELRGAVPVAHHVFDMGYVRAFVLSVIGNMLPVPFILLLLGPVSKVMRRVKLFDRFFEWLFARTRRRSASIEKYQELGLILFIAVPLPVTGAWTGALAAFLLGFRFWLSMLCVGLGVMIAGVIVSVFSAFGWLGAVAAGLILGVISAMGVLGRRKKAQTSPA